MFYHVNTLDGNSEIGAHKKSEIDNLICLRHSFRTGAVANLKSLLTCSKLSSNISTMVLYLYLYRIILRPPRLNILHPIPITA